ncbi:MAG: hypothetical protein AAFY74_09600 [Pseudomonadota bacterium]
MEDLAVLTGDIVKSRELPPDGLDKAFAALGDAARRIEAFGGQPALLTQARGDGWQMVTAPPFVLRASLTLRAAVRALGKEFDTRIGIGTGPGQIRSDSLADASGPAFVASGHALDTMRKGGRMAVEDGSQGLRLAITLANRIVGGWTSRQAEIALESLRLPRPTQDQLASHFDTTQQTIQQHWDASGLPDLLEACEMYEDG